MSWTKKQLLEASFDEIGMANYVYDITPEQLIPALYKLDAMVENWQANGIYLSYPTHQNPTDSTLDEDSNIPGFSVAAVYMNYACRLANSYGKVITDELKKQARETYSLMLNRLGRIYFEVPLPSTLPRGQGTKPWRNFNNPFITPYNEPVFTEDYGVLEIPNYPTNCNKNL